MTLSTVFQNAEPQADGARSQACGQSRLPRNGRGTLADTLAKNLLLNSDIHTTIVTGATSEGAERRPTTHYAWRNDNMVVYRPFAHPQMPEILQVLQSHAAELRLTDPHAADARFILARHNGSQLSRLPAGAHRDHQDLQRILRRPQLHVHHLQDSDLKDVVNTNKCIIHLDKIGGKLLITAVIDNLLREAPATRSTP